MGALAQRTGERVEYDAQRVAMIARQRDPGLPLETARLLAGRAWSLLHEIGELDAPALARQLMSSTQVGATPANVVAVAAVAFCREISYAP